MHPDPASFSRKRARASATQRCSVRNGRSSAVAVSCSLMPANRRHSTTRPRVAILTLQIAQRPVQIEQTVRLERQRRLIAHQAHVHRAAAAFLRELVARMIGREPGASRAPRPPESVRG